MAAAWEQLGEIQRHQSDAASGSACPRRQCASITPGTSTGSRRGAAQCRGARRSRASSLRRPDANTADARAAARQSASSSLPANAISAPLRRLTSPRGRQRSLPAHGASLRRDGHQPELDHAFIQHDDRRRRGDDQPGSDRRLHGPAAASDAVREDCSQTLARRAAARRFQDRRRRRRDAVLSAILPPVAGASPVGQPDNPEAQAFRAAAKEHMDHLAQQASRSGHHLPAPPMDLPDAGAAAAATP